MAFNLFIKNVSRYSAIEASAHIRIGLAKFPQSEFFLEEATKIGNGHSRRKITSSEFFSLSIFPTRFRNSCCTAKEEQEVPGIGQQLLPTWLESTQPEISNHQSLTVTKSSYPMAADRLALIPVPIPTFLQ